jgi:hypothetical protein
MQSFLRYSIGILTYVALGICLIAPEQVRAQIAGPSVNMVSGTQWPGGDPFLQRQNTPSLAVSTRNKLHLMAGDNDYRTVDLPGLPNGGLTGDAWLGVFKSLDGGKTWYSDLLPGYPQDGSPVGLASPLHVIDPNTGTARYQAGSDPVMRAGTNGMFYYAGLVFSRTPVAGGNFGASAISVSRYIDTNAPVGDPFQFAGTSIVAQGASPQTFTDKPWIAVDVPRAGAVPCNVMGQTFPGGNVYVTYTAFQGDQLHGAITFQRSTDCGVTWGVPIQLTDSSFTRQGTAIAIDPNSGAVYVAWRQFSVFGAIDAIYVVKSADGGQTFTPPLQVAAIVPFDQGSTLYTFRTNSYPSITIDGSGEVYIAWSQRGVGPGGDARIVVSTSPDGQAWSAPIPADNQPNRGHQFMPAITFVAGQLMLVYYDLRDDNTFTLYAPLGGDVFSENQTALVDPTALVFSQFVDDTPTVSPAPPRQLRHMMDVRVAQGIPGSTPVFNSTPVSSYSFGSLPPAYPTIEQLQVDPPNFPMFNAGTQAYIGDYLDISAQMFILNSSGNWVYNTAAANDTLFHAVWSDDRDVRPPGDGNWANYTPVGTQGLPSIFDPTQATPQACVVNQEGMRNQNIYTAGVTQGVVVASPNNTKSLLAPQLKAFVITLENTSAATQTFRLTVLNQPVGGRAVFSETTSGPLPLTRVDLSVPAYSTVARSIFVSSTLPNAQVRVQAQQITAPGGSVLAGGLQSLIVLNADPTDPNLIPNPNRPNSEIYTPTIANPNIANPNIANPNIANPNIANPNIANPNIANPNIANPNIANPNIANPNIANPNIANPNIANPNIANPNIANPNIANPNIAAGDLANGTVSDASWTVMNTGNSAMAYTIKTLLNGQVPAGFITQLMVYQFYSTPVSNNCTLGVDVHTKLLANVINPVFEQAANNDASDPAITNGASNVPTVSLSPGETANITLRIVNPDKTTNTNFNPLSTFIVTATSHGVNTADIQQANFQPPVAASQIIILTQTLPNASVGSPYSTTLRSAGGTGAITWSSPNLPANGLSLNPSTGVISGTPTGAAAAPITVTATDSEAMPESATRSYTLTITAPAPPTIASSSLPVGYPGLAYNYTLVATGGATGKTWSVTVGSLPAGLMLNPSTGLISGTPTTLGTVALTITVTDALNQSASRAFNLQIAPVTLTFSQQPGTVFQNQADTTVVKATSSSGVALSGVAVTIALLNGGPAALGGITTVSTNPSGLASFSFNVNLSGNYQLTASAAGATAVNSAAFQITGLAITFLAQPVDTLYASVISPAVQVLVQATGGAAVPGMSVSLSIGNNPSGGTLSGTTTAMTNSSGIAAFANLSIDRPGSGYKLAAVAGGTPGPVSNPFNIAQVIESVGDAAPGNPDLSSGTITISGGNAIISLRFFPGTFNPATTIAQVQLDTDQNPGTGYPGSDTTQVDDAGVIGPEFFVTLGGGGTTALIQDSSFNNVGTVGPVTYSANGLDVTIPLATLSSNGRMNFKVVAYTMPPGGPATAIQDYLPVIASANPDGSVTPPPGVVTTPGVPGIALTSLGTQVTNPGNLTLTINLTQPAPAGGLTTTISTSNASLLTPSCAGNPNVCTSNPGSPGVITLVVPAGSSTATFLVQANSGGSSATITVAAPGYDSANDTLSVM